MCTGVLCKLAGNLVEHCRQEATKMKLVIDLQGAQSNSKHRGIGRYSLALARSIARKAGGHEVWIALNDAFPDIIEPIRVDFDNLVSQDRIVVWQTVTPASSDASHNDWRRRTGEVLRESFLASLKPDIVHVSSLFDGYLDDTVTSVGNLMDGQKTAVTLFDLIPLIQQDVYLRNPSLRTWYYQKIASMRRAGLWLGISESSCREGIELLDLPANKVVNISAAADARFRPIAVTDESAAEIRRRYGLARPFVMYTGATDPRKNLRRLFVAYSRLSNQLRREHQLLVVCPADELEVATLKHEARLAGLRSDELVVASLVPDDDLVILYNLCKAFCFPSVHEGFGLPALEAMQSGAAVIGSNRSSIPEVIGRADALFNPFDEQDISAHLHQVLADSGYRQSLREHGLEQASKFSWEESARRAWDAFEQQHAELTTTRTGKHRRPATRPRLAYVSPLPPAESGIADYSAELLPELGRHYEIDLIVDQPNVNNSEILANYPVRQSEWFAENAQSYERILYHFGNSPFHKHMFDLLDRFPGTVVLHDFFLSSAAAFFETHLNWQWFWTRMLYSSHGYQAFSRRVHSDNRSEIIAKYPANLPVLQNAKGIIVHSEHSRHLAQGYYGNALPNDWEVIPLARRLPREENRLAARKALGFAEQDFVLCSFGIIAPTKLNCRLLQCWLKSRLAHDSNCHLVFVGARDGSGYGRELDRIIASSPFRNRIKVTGFATDEIYRRYLQAADAAVQLRTQSRGETSAAVFDCMAHALPTVVNEHGSLAELPRNRVVMLPDNFADHNLISAIEELRVNPERRRAMGAKARSFVQERHSPRIVADGYHRAIEYFHAESCEGIKQKAIAAVTAMEQTQTDEHDWIALARAINRNLPMPSGQRQLLLDISGLVRSDLKTGIERVTRSILKAFLEDVPAGFRTEPIYAVPGQAGYSYARKFTSQFLDCPTGALEDTPVEVQRGDVYVCLDLQHSAVLANEDFYAGLRRRGVAINFTVYDLLPILRPDVFPPGTADLHARWLSVVSSFADNLICISRSVADEVACWLSANQIERERPLQIKWFHLGSDIERSVATKGQPNDAQTTLATLKSRPSFLMVGTIEPRKGHALALKAFEQLWQEGKGVNLVIVGAEGWKHLPANERRLITELVERLRCHTEIGRRLFWLEGISDEYLEEIYSASKCLIAASEGEGFGLPLIEAARHGMPILARDIPVFREVAGDYADYFAGTKSTELARAITEWLSRHGRGNHLNSNGLQWLTWIDSVAQFKAAVFADTAYKTWLPKKTTDPSAGAEIGNRLIGTQEDAKRSLEQVRCSALGDA